LPDIADFGMLYFAPSATGKAIRQFAWRHDFTEGELGSLERGRETEGHFFHYLSELLLPDGKSLTRSNTSRPVHSPCAAQEEVSYSTVGVPCCPPQL